MPGYIKQTLIALVLILCFGGSLAIIKAIKSVFMNNQLSSVRPTLIDLDSVELHCYSSLVRIGVMGVLIP